MNARAIFTFSRIIITCLVAEIADCVLLMPASAAEDGFDGRTLGFQDFVTYSIPSPPSYGDARLANVGRGTQFHWTPDLLAPWGSGDDTANVSVSDATLSFTFDSTGLYSYGPWRYANFVGFKIYDAGGNPFEIESITVDPATTLQNVSVKFDGTSIAVNLQGTGVFRVDNEINPYTGMRVNPPQILVLDVDFATAPEPSAAALGSVLAAVGACLSYLSGRKPKT